MSNFATNKKTINYAPLFTPFDCFLLILAVLPFSFTFSAKYFGLDYELTLTFC